MLPSDQFVHFLPAVKDTRLCSCPCIMRIPGGVVSNHPACELEPYQSFSLLGIDVSARCAGALWMVWRIAKQNKDACYPLWKMFSHAFWRTLVPLHLISYQGSSVKHSSRAANFVCDFRVWTSHQSEGQNIMPTAVVQTQMCVQLKIQSIYIFLSCFQGCL